MSVKLRLIQPLVLAGVCLIALSPITAAADGPTNYRERVVGVETGFPVPCDGGSASSFAGIALGTINGIFSATICHSSLDNPPATINPGGTFTLSGQTIGGQPAVVSGRFTGGSVFPINSGHIGSFCYQNFGVIGKLGPLNSNATTGSFNAVLTHYGTWTGTMCNVTFATVAGSANFTA